MEDERRAAAYNPWGKGGAGAPMRDAEGKIMANRRPGQDGGGGGGGGGPPPSMTMMPSQQQQTMQMQPGMMTGGGGMPYIPPQTSQDPYGVGMAGMGAGQLAYQNQQAMLMAQLGQPVGVHPNSQPAGGQQQMMMGGGGGMLAPPPGMMGGGGGGMAPRTAGGPPPGMQPQQNFPPGPGAGAGGGGDGGDQKFSRFQFSDLPEWEKDARIRKHRQVDEHKEFLMKQIEDKKRAKAMAEAQEKQADEMDRMRVERQMADEARRVQMEKGRV